MTNYFIPYSGAHPAIVSINGHKLIVVSSDPREVEESLGLLGADSIRAMEGEQETQEECQQQLEQLAEGAEGGVVITPEDVGLEQMLSALKEELPWIQ